MRKQACWTKVFLHSIPTQKIWNFSKDSSNKWHRIQDTKERTFVVSRAGRRRAKRDWRQELPINHHCFTENNRLTLYEKTKKKNRGCGRHRWELVGRVGSLYWRAASRELVAAHRCKKTSPQGCAPALMLLAVSSIRRMLLVQLGLPFWCPPFSLHASRSDNNRHKMKYTVTKVPIFSSSTHTLYLADLLTQGSNYTFLNTFLYCVLLSLSLFYWLCPSG